MVDATVDIRVGPFEGGVGIDWHWVGNRPVQPGKGVRELFVGVVADGDDEIIAVKDLVEAARGGCGRSGARGARQRR